MAFKASSYVPADAYEQAKRTMVALKRQCDGAVSRWNADGASADEVLSAIAQLRQLDVTLSNLSGTSGLAAYAQDQESDPAYDVVAEFVTVRNLIDSALTTLVGNFPKDGSGYLLSHTFDASNIRVPRHFTASNLANAITALQAISDSII